jgi:hypothetical protein
MGCQWSGAHGNKLKSPFLGVNADEEARRRGRTKIISAYRGKADLIQTSLFISFFDDPERSKNGFRVAHRISDRQELEWSCAPVLLR